MELFSRLFGSLLVFVYHCFDRVVINGYLSGISRPEQVVYFFRKVLRIPVITKEVIRQRTTDYQGWVEAFARNHGCAPQQLPSIPDKPLPCSSSSNLFYSVFMM
jgi:hypothetical protein